MFQLLVAGLGDLGPGVAERFMGGGQRSDWRACGYTEPAAGGSYTARISPKTRVCFNRIRWKCR